MTLRMIGVRLTEGQIAFLADEIEKHGTISQAIRAHIPSKPVIKTMEKIPDAND